MNKKRVFWIALVIIVVLIQFIPLGRPETILKNDKDLIVNHNIPDSVSRILKSACYNCHSNETSYPWYSYVAPVSWKIVSDVKEARENVNFSNWDSYDKLEKLKILGDIDDEVKSKDMPLLMYILMHPEAKLTDKQREILEKWSDQFAGSML